MKEYDNLLSEIQFFYDELGERYELIYPGYAKLQKDLAHSILSICDEFDATVIADVACNCGWLLQELVKLRSGLVLYGFDISKRAIDIAEKRREKEGLNLHYTTGDWLRLPEIVDTRFDAVLCLGNSLSHLPLDLQFAALIRFSSILNPGGILLIDTYRNWNHRFIKKVIVEPKGLSCQGSYRVFVCFANEYYDSLVRRHVSFSYYSLAEDRALRPHKVECFSIRQFPVILNKDTNVQEFGFKHKSMCQIRDEMEMFEYYLLSK